MSYEVKVPPMGESVTEASVMALSKKAGDPVRVDDVIAVLETDKVNVDVYSPVSGAVSKWLVKEGDTVTVDAVIAVIDQGDARGEQKAATDQDSVSVGSPAPDQNVQSVGPADGKRAAQDSVKVSPAAGKMIAEHSIDPSSVQGTGKNGMVTKTDVMTRASATGGVSNRVETRIKMSKLRQKVAERLKASQNTAAILTTFNEVDMTNVMAVRAKYKEAFEKRHGVKLGFMSFFVKASVDALLSMPTVNASIEGNEIVYRGYCDIGVAISSDSGLVVPVLRNAEAMSFADIEKAIVAYGKKASSGGLSVEDMTGGTFTVSNGGVFGSLLSTPIINPPQTAILGMHKTQERPIAIGGAVVVRPMMYVALSYDHRLIDGKEAVTFLSKIKQSIEDPVSLLLDL